jgi:hypothetical protein
LLFRSHHVYSVRGIEILDRGPHRHIRTVSKPRDRACRIGLSGTLRTRSRDVGGDGFLWGGLRHTPDDPNWVQLGPNREVEGL